MTDLPLCLHDHHPLCPVCRARRDPVRLAMEATRADITHRQDLDMTIAELITTGATRSTMAARLVSLCWRPNVESAEDLQRMAEVFDVRQALRFDTYDRTWHLCVGEQDDVHLQMFDGWGERRGLFRDDALDLAAGRLYAAGWRAGMSVVDASRLLARAAEDRSKPPPGYEVWDSSRPDEQEPDVMLEEWTWKDGGGDFEHHDNKASALAAAWAHHNAREKEGR